MLDERLRLNVISCLMWDWAHMYASDGVGDHAFGILMKELKTSGSQATYAEVGLYCNSFTWPARAPAIAPLFTAERAKHMRLVASPRQPQNFLHCVPYSRNTSRELPARVEIAPRMLRPL